jgi:hypothetical protein
MTVYYLITRDIRAVAAVMASGLMERTIVDESSYLIPMMSARRLRTQTPTVERVPRVDGQISFWDISLGFKHEFRYRGAKLRRARHKAEALAVNAVVPGVKADQHYGNRITQPARNHCQWRRPG